ncbi:MAG TPA: hypothetical protein VGG10_14995 [Rhizomicrobium sp.]|jgi:hypothetical protein
MSNKLLTSLFEYKAWANRGLYEALLAAPGKLTDMPSFLKQFDIRDMILRLDQ